MSFVRRLERRHYRIEKLSNEIDVALCYTVYLNFAFRIPLDYVSVQATECLDCNSN